MGLPPNYLDKSLWVFHLNSGSCNGCDIEIVALLTPKYDAERFGVKLVGTPKHADVFLITGPVTRAQAGTADVAHVRDETQLEFLVEKAGGRRHE